MEIKSDKNVRLNKEQALAAKLPVCNRQQNRMGPDAAHLPLVFALCLPVLGWWLTDAGFAETLYCPIKNKTTVQVQYGFEQDLPMKTDEGLLIYLDNDPRFLEKIHLEVIISDTLKKYCDGLAVSLYSKLQPVPKEGALPVTGRIDGKKIFFALLPYTNRTFIQIPVVSAARAATTQAAKQSQPTNLPPGTLGVAEAPQPGDFPLLLLIQPVTKGMPDTVLSRDFFINIKPELANKGLLQLTLNNKAKAKSEEFAVRVDDAPINLAQMPMVLAAGIHKLKLESQAYKESIINFSLNPGEQKELQLALEPNKTTLTVEADANAIIFFDNNKLDVSPGEKMEVEPGEHIIRFKIGNYSNSKKLVIQKGKSYTVNLILDIAVKED